MEPSEHRNVIPVDNETSSCATRFSKEGRQYKYCMNVIQQPVRARACGAGAKSSADRRPVDPPPIVELQIFEGEDYANDVTLAFNANYFLFATLEQARPIAHGRVSEDKRPLTVLTGTPVAGMVYLDRPKRAGYFIFPDLSVRHEGLYRLSFSLYEEVKHERDNDKSTDAMTDDSQGDSHVTHRLEVKSKPFIVFSAKKFPGLTESTTLSRIVAEQGCRVRIRRDVRMRRRDTKGGKEWDEYEEDTSQARAKLSQTPDPAAYPSHAFADPIARPRSASNVSHHSHHSQHSIAAISRRQSLQDVSQGYAQPYGASPQTPRDIYGQAAPFEPSPIQQYQPPPFAHQAPTMQPPPPQYHSQSYPPPAFSTAPTQQHYHGGYAPAQTSTTQPQYAAPSYGPPHRLSGDYSAQQGPDSRRSSSAHRHSSSVTGPSPPAYAQPPAALAYVAPVGQPMYHTHPPAHSRYQSLASEAYGAPFPQPFAPHAPYEHAQPSAARVFGSTPTLPGRSSFERPALIGQSLPPLHIPSDLPSRLEPSSPTHPSSSYYTSATSPADNHKRSFGNVFSDKHLHQPLRQGARPSTPGSQSLGYTSQSSVYPPDDDYGVDQDLDTISMKMTYRRADGRSMLRALPEHI